MVRVGVEPRLSTATNKAEKASKDRSVVPWSHSLRYHGTNSVVFVHHARALAKEYPLSKLFSMAEPLPFEPEKNINLVCSSCLRHANEMLLGDPRQAD